MKLDKSLFLKSCRIFFGNKAKVLRGETPSKNFLPAINLINVWLGSCPQDHTEKLKKHKEIIPAKFTVAPPLYDAPLSFYTKENYVAQALQTA